MDIKHSIVVIATVVAAAAWAVKAIAIAAAGGLDQSPWESPLFLLGLLAFLTSVVALALLVSRGRSRIVRAGVVLGAVVGSIALTAAANAAVQLVATSDHWIWGEVNLWLGCLVLIAAAMVTRTDGLTSRDSV